MIVARRALNIGWYFRLSLRRCEFQKWVRMRGVKSGFFIEVDANTYKSGCEWFQNTQKRMRTVFKLLQCPYSAFAPPVLEGYGRSLRRTFLNQESVRRTRRAASRFLMPSEHFKSPFERAIVTTLKIYFGINRNPNIRRDSSAIERLPGLGQIQFIRESESPPVR